MGRHWHWRLLPAKVAIGAMTGDELVQMHDRILCLGSLLGTRALSKALFTASVSLDKSSTDEIKFRAT